ncbi:MAG: DUF2252 family protein [Sandaracinaceae bacterium]
MMQPLLRALAASTLFACSGPATTTGTGQHTIDHDEAPSASRLAIDIEHTDFARNPQLLGRLRESPHGYFRFIHRQFLTAVCTDFADSLDSAPPVNLHGDAHLEQYAVTDLGRGLTDFDGATTGPALLDLVRLGVSVHLAMRAHGWTGEEDAVFDGLLDGYREGLFATDDTPIPDEPRVVRRIHEGFVANPQRLTDVVDEMMQPVPDATQRAIADAMDSYVQVQHEQDPHLADRFFDVERIGRIDLGIGSALDEKFLIRVRGETEAPEDDAVLEAKEVISLAGIPCIQASPEPDPFRILLGQARIAYQPFPYLGFIRAMGTTLWIHGWTNHYHEVSIEEYESPEELAELAHDIGVQLGRGHVNAIAYPLDLQLRRSQGLYLEEHGAQLHDAVRTLATETIATWEAFVRETDDHPSLIATSGEEAP